MSGPQRSALLSEAFPGAVSAWPGLELLPPVRLGSTCEAAWALACLVREDQALAKRAAATSVLCEDSAAGAGRDLNLVGRGV